MTLQHASPVSMHKYHNNGQNNDENSKTSNHCHKLKRLGECQKAFWINHILTQMRRLVSASFSPKYNITTNNNNEGNEGKRRAMVYQYRHWRVSKFKWGEKKVHFHRTSFFYLITFQCDWVQHLGGLKAFTVILICMICQAPRHLDQILRERSWGFAHRPSDARRRSMYRRALRKIVNSCAAYPRRFPLQALEIRPW